MPVLLIFVVLLARLEGTRAIKSTFVGPRALSDDWRKTASEILAPQVASLMAGRALPARPR